MTVACGRQQKRQANDGSESSCEQSHKKLRMMEPLQVSNRQPSPQPFVGTHLSSPSGPGATTASAKAHKKRTRVDGLEPCASPAAGKRGRRPDGSCTTAVSPRFTAAALEEQLTFPGLEKDPDLEVQQVYISRQLQQSFDSRPAVQQPAAVARVSGPQRQASDVANDCAKDAPKGSSGRDQAHSRRGRDQQQTLQSTAVEEAPSHPSAAETSQPQEHVCLNLVTDKEWQRLFAVLTISGQTSRTGEVGQELQQQAISSAVGARSNAPGLNNAAVATSATLEVAPATPSRCEAAPQAEAPAVAAEIATPTRKSFLLTEFTRVQARLTPDREMPPQPCSSCMEVMG